MKEKRHLFWSTKNYAGLSKAAVVEGVLNYGDMDDVRELLALLGTQEVAKIFKQHTTNQKRTNYRPEIVNYFQLYFRKHA